MGKHMETSNCADRLPFYEVQHHPVDDRFGRIKVGIEQIGQIGFLDYFYGFSEGVMEKAREQAMGVKDAKPGFYVMQLSVSKDVLSDTLERGLFYIAACIADNAGEEVLYCRPQETTGANTLNMWEILGVRSLLENYDSLVQQV